MNLREGLFTPEMIRQRDETHWHPNIRAASESRQAEMLAQLRARVTGRLRAADGALPEIEAAIRELCLSLCWGFGELWIVYDGELQPAVRLGLGKRETSPFSRLPHVLVHQALRENQPVQSLDCRNCLETSAGQTGALCHGFGLPYLFGRHKSAGVLFLWERRRKRPIVPDALTCAALGAALQ